MSFKQDIEDVFDVLDDIVNAARRKNVCVGVCVRRAGDL